MKLTWFGGTTFRIHIGGRILVTDPAAAPARIDPQELRSGADIELGLGAALAQVPQIDPARWQPRRPPSMLDDSGGVDEVLVHRVGDKAVLIDAVGEPPLLLAWGPVEPLGRWSREAVVVTCGEAGQARELAASVLDRLAPRLVAVAAAEQEVEAVFARLRDRLAGTALVALERGLALEA